MIKQFIIVAQLLGLFFYQLFFTVDLTVTQKMPASIVQGEEAIVEITIDKADLPGFAQIQQNFPDGFTAEPIETKGATFSFKDNKLKLIWMSLPEEKIFTISYKIIPNETVEGNFTLGGSFAFISESKRQKVEIPVSSFSVVKKTKEEVPVIAAVVSEEIAEPSLQESLAVVINEEPEVEAEVVEEVQKEEAEPTTSEISVVEEVVEKIVAEEKPVIEAIEISCKRTIESISNGKYKITIEVNKKGIEGFCKITEKIPGGFVASEDNSNKGVFSFKDNTMKILWLGVPKEAIYAVSYFVEAEPGTENGQYDIVGLYSYLENDATNKYIIDGTSFDLEREELIVEETVIVTPPAAVVMETPTVEELVIAEVVEQEKVVEKQKVEEVVIAEVVEKEKVVEKTVAKKEAVTSIPLPEIALTYKVQVGAGHEKVPSTYFATVFKLRDKVSTINHEGWIKYLVGSYDAYKAARDKRNVVRANVKTAFVTAYNSGTRITVQEALMISNQKWYK